MLTLFRRLLELCGFEFESKGWPEDDHPETGMPTGARLRLRAEPRDTFFDLTQAPLTIGRDPHNDVVLLDRTVRRSHARVVRERGAHVLEAARGARIRVNGLSCDRESLSDGDEIDIGDFRLRFESA